MAPKRRIEPFSMGASRNRATIYRAVIDSLASLGPSSSVEQALNVALLESGIPRLPDNPAQLDSFLAGPLREALSKIFEPSACGPAIQHTRRLLRHVGVQLAPVQPIQKRVRKSRISQEIVTAPVHRDFSIEPPPKRPEPATVEEPSTREASARVVTHHPSTSPDSPIALITTADTNSQVALEMALQGQADISFFSTGISLLTAYKEMQRKDPVIVLDARHENDLEIDLVIEQLPDHARLIVWGNAGGEIERVVRDSQMRPRRVRCDNSVEPEDLAVLVRTLLPRKKQRAANIAG